MHLNIIRSKADTAGLVWNVHKKSIEVELILAIRWIQDTKNA